MIRKIAQTGAGGVLAGALLVSGSAPASAEHHEPTPTQAVARAVDAAAEQGLTNDVQPVQSVILKDASGVPMVVQALADGSVRTSTVIPNAKAPKTYRYKLPLPKSVKATMTKDGGVKVTAKLKETMAGDTLTAKHVTLAKLAPAWAVDAKGKSVRSWYTLKGNVLTQHVAFTKNTAFPVVADPWWDTAWKVTKCGGAIAAAVVGVGFPVFKLVQFVRWAGGVKTAAQLLTQATRRDEKIEILAKGVGSGAAAILGIDGISRHC